MIAEGDWRRDPRVQRVMAALTDGGHRALFVGGCVRNALLGVPVDDVDVSTDARPDRVVSLAKQAGLRPVPTGIDHGTVTVVCDGIGVEVTTFRRDVDTDGRRATVAFADDVAEDASRRDFTMNALYAEADGRVVDPLGGLDDLRARRLRFVGDARARIREDYLRILRYFRFHAWYGDPDGGLDPDALDACAREAEGIARLSRERVTAETLKLLSAPDPAMSVAAMATSGILWRILPGADPAALAPLVHFEGGRPGDALRRLAVIGGETEGLRLSRKQSARLAVLREAMSGDGGVAELAYRHGAEVARDAALLRAATALAPPPDDLEAQIDAGARARFPLRGQDLAGRHHGPELGEALRALEALWIASGFTLDRKALLAADVTLPRKG